MIENLLSPSALAAFGEVVMIDLVLAGDNAVVVGALAAGLPRAQQRKVILVGIGAALVLRIMFAVLATQLLQIIGLLFAGGILLLWVAWKMARELQSEHASAMAADQARAPRSFAQAVRAVALADVAMSLDNVLGVAGAARDHVVVMVIGLVLSVALMGLAANAIARVIERMRWIAYVGLVVIVWVAAKMIWEGWHEIAPHVSKLVT
jgi:YjbE family integral membrane protein